MKRRIHQAPDDAAKLARVRVQIISDIRLYREGVSLLLDQSGTFEVIKATEDRQTSIDALLRHRPDVVLLDMTCAESTKIVADIREQSPDVPVVALAVSNLENDIIAAIEAGVSGYVGRDASTQDLLSAIESAATGELRCSPRIAGSLLRRVAALANAGGRGTVPCRLTLRERDVARLVQQDLSNKEIAACLNIEVATVKNHVHNLLDKLNVRRRRDVTVNFNLPGAASPRERTLPR